MPAAWRGNKPHETRRRWPSIASRSHTPCVSPRQSRPSPRTNPPALPHPSRRPGERKSPAAPAPVPVCDAARMGSTIVAVYIQGNEFSIANVGDSRIYLVRGKAIQQLTSDHSLVMEQVRRGIITMEQAERSKMQNVILRALGSEESVEPEIGRASCRERV